MHDLSHPGQTHSLSREFQKLSSLLPIETRYLARPASWACWSSSDARSEDGSCRSGKEIGATKRVLEEWFYRSPSPRPSPPGEGESLRRWFEIACDWSCRTVIRNTRNGLRLFLLHGGEGQDEGERHNQLDSQSLQRPRDRAHPSSSTCCGINLCPRPPSPAGFSFFL